MRTVIATVGTSLLTNPDIGVDDDKKRPWFGWRQGCKLPDKETMLKYLRDADMRKASAETNTFQALPLQDDDKIVLLHTQTDDGRICAEVIKDFYKEQGYLVEAREITFLNYLEKSFEEKGLKSLVAILFEEIDKSHREKRTPILCATGGFKAEIAFLNLAGILMGVEVYYIYEKFEKLIRFPTFPIRWNTNIIEENISFFEWIDEEPRSSKEVENRLYQHRDLIPLVVDGQDGNSYLSAAGDLLYKAYKQARKLPRASWPKESDRSPREKIQISSVAHARPRNWERVVDEISRIDCVEYIRYDGSASSRNRNAGIYKTDPEKGDIYVAYKNDDLVFTMVIGTTARGEEQCNLVANYIDRKVKRD